ncbi:MAG: histidine phosphatase family protein [Propionibacteriaceae bacterium]|jgi:broad specificity phosphatase PhoE|nr:histidine phosphatase family protein [Propionibacteriaceae bacterium]
MAVTARVNGLSALVHVCRHGEVYNPDGVLYGRLPGFHLSANGRAMAARLGEYFAASPLSMLRSSPLERAQETMAPIAANHPELEVLIDERLIEADTYQQGQVVAGRKLLRNPRNWLLYRNPWRPSWGEPYAEMARRMLSVVEHTAAAVGPGGEAVLVSHQSPIYTCRLAAERKPLPNLDFQRECILGSVTTFEVVDGDIVAVHYAEPARDLLRSDPHKALSTGAEE